MIDSAPKKYQSVNKIQITDYILAKLFDCPFTIRLVSGFGHPASAIAATLTGEAGDRLAIKELIDAYAHDADRREAEKQANLFTVDGVM
jgi:hypothetical protein